jgi:large subunit ribosomal protein L47
MARVKYVLNERRLGMMAIAQPEVESTLADQIMAEIEGEGDESVARDEEVGKEEVEARDEGFGGGQEAKDFVNEVEVKDGHVEKK